MMARAPGVGPKLAARLVLELKDKAPASSAPDFAGAEVGLERASRLPRAAEDAILALVGLGYAAVAGRRRGREDLGSTRRGRSRPQRSFAPA